jgi:hypothetical protein
VIPRQMRSPLLKTVTLARRHARGLAREHQEAERWALGAVHRQTLAGLAVARTHPWLLARRTRRRRSNVGLSSPGLRNAPKNRPREIADEMAALNRMDLRR